MAADELSSDLETAAEILPPRSERLAYYHRDLVDGPHDANPFLNPPPGYEAGLQAGAVDDLVSAVANGQHVLVTGSRGSGKFRVIQEFYDRLFTGPERIVASPEPISFERLRSSEATEVATVLHVAAVGLISLMEMPTDGARAASSAIRSLSRAELVEQTTTFVETLLTNLAAIARESDRSLVLRMRGADKLSRRQMDLLVRTMAFTDRNCPDVRMVVCGLPSLKVSMVAAMRTLAMTTAATEVALHWRLDRSTYNRAANYIVDMTADTSRPFTADAAYALLDQSQGLKSLINEVGVATWDFAKENDLPEVSESTVRMVAPQVIARMRSKYQHALDALKAGHPSARYVKALYDLTRETGHELHFDEAVLARAGMTPRQGPTAKQREELRAEGYTMRSIDGKVGLADPHLGLVMELLVPETAHVL